MGSRKIEESVEITGALFNNGDDGMRLIVYFLFEDIHVRIFMRFNKSFKRFNIKRRFINVTPKETDIFFININKSNRIREFEEQITNNPTLIKREKLRVDIEKLKLIINQYAPLTIIPQNLLIS